MASQGVVVGVDLGGTNVRAVAIDSDGTIVGERIEQPSYAQDGIEATLEATVSVISKAIAASSVTPSAVGLAIPGRVDDETGIVVWAPNLGKMVDGVFENWENVSIRDPLEKRIGIPVHMGNDANLAALGEYKYGSGKNKARCLTMLTLGTGIGGGVVFAPYAVQGDARGPLLLLGGNKGGAELGHMCILHGGLDCNAGTYGAMEAYCQRDAILRRAIHKLNRGRPSILNQAVGGDLGKLNPKMLSEAAEKGDEVAIEVWHEVGTYLGVGIGSLINIFAPDVFAIGGQVSKAGEFLLAPARRAARDVAITTLFADTSIVVAEQSEDAGLLGAAAMVQELNR